MEYMENQMDDLITGAYLQQEESYSFKLISSKCFGKSLKDKTDSEYRRLRDNFDHFIEQPLALWMFVPCDDEGNVLEEPERWNDYLLAPESFDGNKEWYELYAYQQAKERVLFEGFEVKKDICYKGEKRISVDYAIYIPTMRTLTIEELISKKKTPLTLTETAIKQIGL